MAKNNNEDFKTILLKDIEKYEHYLCKYIGEKVAEDLSEEAFNSIKYFYTSYHPKYYVRNYNFWKSYKSSLNIKGNKATAGVELLVDQLPNDYIKQSGYTKYSSYSLSQPEDVFWRVWGFGWHGIASLQECEVQPPIMSPSPYNRLINKRKDIINNYKEYEKEAMKKVQKLKYNVLQF